MSASTEALLIEINKVRNDIEARRGKEPVSDLEQLLEQLNRKLEASNAALNESANIIKG